MHILNILADKTLPCLTPLQKRKNGDPDLLIRREELTYQKRRRKMTERFTPLLKRKKSLTVNYIVKSSRKVQSTHKVATPQPCYS